MKAKTTITLDYQSAMQIANALHHYALELYEMEKREEPGSYEWSRYSDAIGEVESLWTRAHRAALRALAKGEK